MAELGPLPEAAWAKDGGYLPTDVGLRGKRQRKPGWGPPHPSRRVTWSLNRPQQSEHEGPCQVQEAEEEASNQPEFRHVLSAKQREMGGSRATEVEVREITSAAPLSSLPCSLVLLGRGQKPGLARQSGSSKPDQKKKVIMPPPQLLASSLQPAELGSGHRGEARSLAQLLQDFYLLALDI